MKQLALEMGLSEGVTTKKSEERVLAFDHHFLGISRVYVPRKRPPYLVSLSLVSIYDCSILISGIHSLMASQFLAVERVRFRGSMNSFSLLDGDG